MSKKELKRTFKVTYVDDNDVEHEVECKLQNPSTEQLEEAQAIYLRTWKKALSNGAILATKLKDFVKEHDLWDEKKDIEVNEIRKKLSDAERRLAKGGFSLNEARNLAIQMRKWRFELRELVTVETELENKTAESQADEAKHNYLLVSTTVYNDSEEPVWKSVGEYLNPSIPELAVSASIKYATLRWGVEENFEEKLPENVFLKRYNFVDDKLRLINKDGHLIDLDGNPIDEDGNLVDENENLIDEDGNLITKDGRIKVEEFQPFLDDEGQPIEVPESNITE